MGRFSNFALVFARLVIDENDFGVAPFLVQTRSLETHRHMPGVKCGDLGPKFGYHTKDNGWLTFDRVRIPRSQMLQKFIQVGRDGEVSIEGDLRVLYSVMLLTRTQIINNTSSALQHALVIALRYSAVRRQFRNISGQKEETVLLDYQTQQFKLFPLMASMFAQQFAAEHMNKLFRQLMKDIQAGKFELLDLCHHFSAGMKSVFTQNTFDGLVQIRQSLGGAGYSAWSGIPNIIEDFSPNPTFEGDNTVMA